MSVIFDIKTSELSSISKRLDSEYYQPYFLNLEKSLRKTNNDRLLTIADITDGSHEIRSYVEEGILFLRVQDIFETGLNIKEPVYISLEEDKILSRSSPSIGNVLITKTGKIGVSIVFSKYNAKCNLPADIAIARLKTDVNPFYLATFLNCKFGQDLLNRELSGSGRPRLVLDNLNNIIIPYIPKQIEKQIEVLVSDAYNKNKKSQELYPETEKELLDRIKFEEINTNHVLTYKASSKDFNDRVDPEFFQPKFINLVNYLKKNNGIRLGNFCPVPNRGVQPKYFDSGKILVINSKCLGQYEIDIENTEKTSEDFYKEDQVVKSRLLKHDVLMYSTGAYVGRTNAYLEEKKAIASNHVTIIRPDKSICHPVYLALYLNSTFGLLQTDQRASGSAQREIYPQDIVEYLVFIPRNKNGTPDMVWQQKLADKVIQSNTAKKEAEQKIKEAKVLVEKEIYKLIKNN